jgi:hypothetical protein
VIGDETASDEQIRNRNRRVLIARAARHSSFPAAPVTPWRLTYQWSEFLVKITCGDVDLAATPPTIAMEVISRDRIRHPLTAATVAILRPLVVGHPLASRLLLWPDDGTWASGDALAFYWYRQIGENVTPTGRRSTTSSDGPSPACWRPARIPPPSPAPPAPEPLRDPHLRPHQRPTPARGHRRAGKVFGDAQVTPKNAARP